MLKDILAKTVNVKIAVVGDFMLDKYVFGEVHRISPEAPVQILSKTDERYYPGGAGNVAANLAALGAKVGVFGILGNDSNANKLTEIFLQRGISTDLCFYQDNRPTTVKERFVVNKHQLLRVDNESTDWVSPLLLERITKELASIGGYSAIILSDYGKGVCTQMLCEWTIQYATALNIPVIVDPKGIRYDKYKGATAITPNHHEAEEVYGRKFNGEDDIGYALWSFYRSLAIEYPIITHGSDGIYYMDNQAVKHSESKAREVCDVSGAGDTVVAVLSYCLANDIDISNAVDIANIAAGISVGHVGTAAVSKDEIMKELLT